MTIRDSSQEKRSRREEVIRHIDRAERATVSLPQVAQVIGINRTTAWELVQRDEFPVRTIKVGSRYRVTKWDLARYLIGDEDFSSDDIGSEEI
jgi:predicted DNA-binding transcriptional regulator AlpA